MSTTEVPIDLLNRDVLLGIAGQFLIGNIEMSPQQVSLLTSLLGKVIPNAVPQERSNVPGSISVTVRLQPGDICEPQTTSTE